MPDATDPPVARPFTRPLQFSLRTLLLVLTLVAVVIGMWTVLPWMLLIVGLAWLLGALPTVLVILVVYARGTPRAFAIGAMVPLVMGWPLMEENLPAMLIFAPLASLVAGLLAVWLRRVIHERGWDRADRPG